jgi:hypothetical protein
MLKVSAKQREMLNQAIEEAFVREVCRHLRAEHAPRCEGLDDAELSRRARVGIARARIHDLEWDTSITAFVAIMFEVAPTFDEQPAIRRVLGDRRVSPSQRIDALWDRTTEEDWDEAERYGERAEAFWSSAGAGERA